jgi:hypothetical protein
MFTFTQMEISNARIHLYTAISMPKNNNSLQWFTHMYITMDKYCFAICMLAHTQKIQKLDNIDTRKDYNEIMSCNAKSYTYGTSNLSYSLSAPGEFNLHKTKLHKTDIDIQHITNNIPHVSHMHML